MRGITIFLAFIIFGLSCLPCADRGAFTFTAKTQVIEQLGTTHDHAGAMDICGPFCSCACCSVLQVNVKLNMYEFKLNPDTRAHNTFYLPGSVAALPLPIWQPPQLLA